MVLACYGLSAGAQVRESENFLYLYSDSIIYAENVRVRADLSGSFQLRADGKRFPLAQVKFFNNQDGFFANTWKIGLLSTTFSERIIEGKINLFQETSYTPDYLDRRYRHGYHYSGSGQLNVDASMYYNKGFSDLKKVNYNNLQADMTDNANSMRFLQQFKQSRTTRNLLYGGAAASILGFLATAMFEGKRGIDSSATPTYVFMGTTGLFAVAGYLVDLRSNHHLESAIDEYNR